MSAAERIRELERRLDEAERDLGEIARCWCGSPYSYEEEYDELVEAVLDLERGVLTLDDVLAKINRRWVVAR